MASAGGAGYWWSLINAPTTDGFYTGTDSGSNVHTVLSDGSVVVVGQDNGSPGNPGKYGRAVKLNPDGSKAWETAIGNTIESGNRGYNLSSVTCDSSDNIYTVGRYYYGDKPYCLVKLNPSTGAVVAQDEFDTSGSYFLNLTGYLGVNSSSKGGLVLAGEIQQGSTDSTSSVIVHSIADLSNKSSKDTYADPQLDLGNGQGGWVSNNSAYVMARPWNNGNSRGQVQKINIGSGGTSQSLAWGRQFYPNSYTHRSRAVVSSMDDNDVYIYCDFQSGFGESVGTRSHTIFKVNSSGDPTAASRFHDGGNNSGGPTSRLRLDSNGNVYCFTRISGVNNIVKYNSSLQKQHHFTISYQSPIDYLFIRNMELDSEDNIILAGSCRLTTETYYGTWVMKIPNDASLTGNYGGIVLGTNPSGYSYYDQINHNLITSSTAGGYENATRSQTAQNHFYSASGQTSKSVTANEVIS